MIHTLARINITLYDKTLEDLFEGEILAVFSNREYF